MVIEQQTLKIKLKHSQKCITSSRHVTAFTYNNPAEYISIYLFLSMGTMEDLKTAKVEKCDLN